MARKFGAELLGTAILVFFAAGIVALVFGFRIFGASLAAGMVAIGIVFGLVYTALAHVIGPVSGGHINPAVTLGAFLSKRISLLELGYYWLAQLIGSLLGALVLWWVLSTSPYFSKPRIGLGANGYGGNSILHIGAGGAFLIEVILTAVFVLAALSLMRKAIGPVVAAAGIGIALALTSLIGSPFDGASINPARSFGPAVIQGGTVLSQLWVFLLAPLVGAVLAAGVYQLLHPEENALREFADMAMGRGTANGNGRYAEGNGHHAEGNGHRGDEGTWRGGESGQAAGTAAGPGGQGGYSQQAQGQGAGSHDEPAEQESGEPHGTGQRQAGERKPVWRRF